MKNLLLVMMISIILTQMVTVENCKWLSSIRLRFPEVELQRNIKSEICTKPTSFRYKSQVLTSDTPNFLQSGMSEIRENS